MAYRSEMISKEAFIRQLVTGYLHHGFWWYVTGTIPSKKNPQRVDQNIVSKYEIDLSRREQAYRKQQGFAAVRYLRHDRFFMILATKGRHAFKAGHAGQLRDIRKDRLLYGGYAVRYAQAGLKRSSEWKHPGMAERDPKRRGHVRIEQKIYRELRAYFLELAMHRSADKLRSEFWNVPFDAYQPVQWQLHTIRRVVNELRGKAGFELVPADCIRSRLAPISRYHPVA